MILFSIVLLLTNLQIFPAQHTTVSTRVGGGSYSSTVRVTHSVPSARQQPLARAILAVTQDAIEKARKARLAQEEAIHIQTETLRVQAIQAQAPQDMADSAQLGQKIGAALRARQAARTQAQIQPSPQPLALSASPQETNPPLQEPGIVEDVVSAGILETIPPIETVAPSQQPMPSDSLPTYGHFDHEDLKTIKQLLSVEDLGLTVEEIHPEALRACFTITRNAGFLEIFNEDPQLMYKYLSKVHLESYAKGEGINPIGIRKRTITDMPVEEITVRHARPGDIKNKGTNRTSWTTDDIRAVEIAQSEGAGRDQVVVTSEKKLEMAGIETKDTPQLLKETADLKAKHPEFQKGIEKAEFHYTDKREMQTVGGVPNELTRSLRFYEARSPIMTDGVNKVLSATESVRGFTGIALSAAGILTTMTQDSPVRTGTTVIDPFDPHYWDQGAFLVEKLILACGGTVYYKNMSTGETWEVIGKPFWKK